MSKETKPPATDDADERTTAVGLYHYAESYRDCADALSIRQPNGLMFDAPIYFLYFHAVELYLKAFLRSVGYSARELAKPAFGHKLGHLHDTSVKEGLVLSRYPDAFFDFLDPAEIIGSRYIKTGYISRPSIEALGNLTTEIRTAVAASLKASGHHVRWWQSGNTPTN